ncbi:acyltransferase domain-containing protein [Streptomyces sp. NPDC058861]|uniref:acyltransferase domain-containing protein n=1 Tax=Streptomyces sp. NPDC058861 TaxID=3346653 RepID=UPI0036C4DAB0
MVRGRAADGPSGPVVFVFPGQGSQWLAMGKRLYAGSEVFARSVDACERALAPYVDWSLVDVLTGAGTAPSLDRVDVVQPALFSMMVSLARVWRSFGVVPDAVVGHSQGEIAAACAAGALGLDDAARIVALRSRAVVELLGRDGGMSAVAAPADRVGELLAPWSDRISVAAVNGPSSVVVAGDGAALDAFGAAAEAAGVRVRRVKVDYASHSHHVERLRERVLEVTEGIAPRETAVRFHSTVTGGPLDTRSLDGAYWYANLRSMVRFGEVVEDLMRVPGAVFVEVSPHPVLQVAMEEAADALPVPPPVAHTLSRHDGGAGEVLASLAGLHVRGVPVDWGAVFAPHRPRRVALPTYAFQRERHWPAGPGGPADREAAERATGPAPGVPGPVSAETVLALVCAETAALLSAGNAALTGADLATRADDSFKSLGFDSSMAVGLRNRIGAAAGVRLPATVVFTRPTPRALADHVLSLLAPEEPGAPEAKAPEAKAPEPAAEAPGPEHHDDDDLYALIDRGYV